jgi:ArsR family transcriptional regulator
MNKVMQAVQVEYGAQAQLYQVLSHPVRLALLDVLRDGEQCVCHMEAHLGLRQAYISQHLMVLREAGLVSDRKDGWNVFYRIARPEVFAAIDGAVAALGLSRRTRTRNHTEADCPCPKCNQTEAAASGGQHA